MLRVHVGLSASGNPAYEALTLIESTLERLEWERDDLGNQLAQERSKPEGSFDQWALLQATEARAARYEEALIELRPKTLPVFWPIIDAALTSETEEPYADIPGAGQRGCG